MMNSINFVVKALILAVVLLVIRSPIAMALIGVVSGILTYHLYPLETKGWLCKYSSTVFEFFDLSIELASCSSEVFI